MMRTPTAPAPATEPAAAAATIVKAGPTAGLLQILELVAQGHGRGVEVAVVVVVQGQELCADGGQVRSV